jgi:hypothetical protein
MNQLGRCKIGLKLSACTQYEHRTISSAILSFLSFDLGSVRQFDPVGVFLLALVFFSKNLFEPMRLTVSDRPINERGRMTDDEVFAAYVAPQDPHRLKISSRLVWRLVFLYCHCLHLLDFSDWHG